jgi:hypothetical protein
MPTVELDSEFEVYADVADADAYLDAALHGQADWDALDDDAKARALVTATRTLDRQAWRGEKTDPAQALAWPRTGTGVAGVEDNAVPQGVVDASIELALALAQGSEVQNEQNTGQKLQSIKAGSVALTYFRGADGVPVRFPLIVQELIRAYLAGAGLSIAMKATGVLGTPSASVDDFGHTEGI